MADPQSNRPALSRIGPPWWDDKPLAIVGAGPSLAGFDFSRLDLPDVRILAVNEKIFDLPFADAVFSLDRPWINMRADKLRELRCEVYLAPTGSDKEGVALIKRATYLALRRTSGLSDDLSVLESGAHSGYAAFNLAWLKRAGRPGRPIVLFGYDYRELGALHHDKPEQYHWYRAGHNARYLKNWGDNFMTCLPQLRAAGAIVFNASPMSTCDAFSKCSIDDGIEILKSEK